MKRPLATASAFAAITASLALSAPSSADASPLPDVAPVIESVGGVLADTRGIKIDDDRPEIIVSWAVDHPDSLLRVVDDDSHEFLCDGTATSGSDRFSCTTERALSHTQRRISAYIVSADGARRSRDTPIVPIHLAIPESTIHVDSYDPATKSLALSGVADQATQVTVASDSPNTTPVNADLEPAWAWTAIVENVERPSTVEVVAKNGKAVSRARMALHDPAAPAGPAAEVRDVGGQSAGVKVGGVDASATITITASTGSVLAGGPASTREFLVPASPAEEHYFVTSRDRGGVESRPTEVILHPGNGSGSSEPPSIVSTTVREGRVVVAMAGEPGSVLSIRDREGTTVATKLIGRDGTTRASFTAAGPTGAAHVYSMTQRSAAAASQPTPFLVTMP